MRILRNHWTGEIADIVIEGHDSIEDIAAITHYTTRELCEKLERLIRKDLNEQKEKS